MNVPRLAWIRTLLLGASAKTLERIWMQTQNDYNPDPTRISSSAGDVIHIANRLYLIKAVGFEPISTEKLTQIRRTPRFERWRLTYNQSEP